MTYDPYAGLTTAQKAMTPAQRMASYVFAPYDAVKQPFGFWENGHLLLWPAFLADLVAMGLTATQQAQMVATYLAGSNGWVQETHAVTRYSANQVAVAGVDLTTTGPVNIAKIRRKASVVQTSSAYLAVTAATYDAGNNRTLVTFDGAIDTGITALWWGQEPDNAPKVQTGQANGVCGLDSNAQVPSVNLPPINSTGSTMLEFAIMGD